MITQDKHKKMRLVYGLASLMTLMSGVVIYILFRDINNMILFLWVLKPHFFESVLVPLKSSLFSNFLRFHLPDMLWFLSAILFFRFMWFDEMKMQKVYISCCYGAGLVLEVSQLSKNIPGTFDWFDLFFLGIAVFVESLLYKILIGRRSY